MLNQEELVSKNFHSEFGEIPSIQISAMNNMVNQRSTRAFEQKSTSREKKSSELSKEAKKRKRIESITKRYMNQQGVPRYMSPTIVARTKIDMKKSKALDTGDALKYDQVLRK